MPGRQELGQLKQSSERLCLCLDGQVLAAEGPAGLYRGFPAVLVGVLPANALYYATYELLKGHLPGALGGAAVGAAAQARPARHAPQHSLVLFSAI